MSEIDSFDKWWEENKNRLSDSSTWECAQDAWIEAKSQLADREKAIVERLNDIILMPETNFMEWGPRAEIKLDKLKSDIESGTIDNKKESGDE